MKLDRREFVLGSVLAAAGCASVKAASGPKPTRFEPIKFEQLEERPDFWKVRVNEIISLCESATKCSRKEVIATTPLGYPVHALFYGDFNDAPPQTNWSAGSSSRTYRSYYGNRKDGKQTFLFIAGIHGAEPECVAGAVNLIKMLETGTDFRGKRDDELVGLISKYRFIIVPCVNMDGRALSPDHLRGLNFEDFRRASQGYWKDGSLVGWRGSKNWFPLPLDKVAYPGGYPNADGFNIMHDACPGNIRTAEARGLLKLAERWRVDAVLNGHSYEFAPSILTSPGIGMFADDMDRALDIREHINEALCKEGLRDKPTGRGKAGKSINLNTLLSLASGAITLTLESSVSFDRPIRGTQKPTRTYTFEELMQPTFVALREYLKDGLEKPFLVRGDERVRGD